MKSFSKAFFNCCGDGDTRSALAIMKDIAELEGLYVKKLEVEVGGKVIVDFTSDE